MPNCEEDHAGMGFRAWAHEQTVICGVAFEGDAHVDVHDDIWTTYRQKPSKEVLSDGLDFGHRLSIDCICTFSEASVWGRRLESLADQSLSV